MQPPKLITTTLTTTRLFEISSLPHLSPAHHIPQFEEQHKKLKWKGLIQLFWAHPPWYFICHNRRRFFESRLYWLQLLPLNLQIEWEQWEPNSLPYYSLEILPQKHLLQKHFILRNILPPPPASSYSTVWGGRGQRATVRCRHPEYKFPHPLSTSIICNIFQRS